MADPRPFVRFPAVGARCVDWSRDGRWIALGSTDDLRLVDPDDRAPGWQVPAAADNAVKFSPDGHRVAACSAANGSVRLEMYDVDSGTRLWSRGQNPVNTGGDAPLDPDNPVGNAIGQFLAEGIALALLMPYLQRQAHALFSPDSRLVAHGSLVLNVSNGTGALTLPPAPPAVGMRVPMPPAFSPDGLQLATPSEGGITVLDTRTGQPIWSTPCPEKPVWAHFMDDGLWVVCDPAFEIMHFDGAGREIGRHPLDPRTTVTALFTGKLPALLDATPDGASLLAVGGSLVGRVTAVVHRSDGTPRFPFLALTRAEGASVTEVAARLSPAGERVAINRPGLTVLRTRSGSVDWQVPDGGVADVGYHPDGSRLAALVGDELRLYDTGLRAPRARAAGPVSAVSVSGGALPLVALASVAEDGQGVATLHLAREGSVVVERLDQGLVSALRLTSNGQRLATGRTTGVAAVYDTLSGDRLADVRHGDDVRDVAFDSSGTLMASASADRTAALVEAGNGSERWRAEHPRAVRLVVIDPGGDWVATACADKGTRILDSATGHVRATFSHEGQIRALDLARGGRLVVAAYEGGAVLVIDAVAGSLVGQAVHPRPVLAAALNPAGDVLASGGRDNSVRLSAVTAAGVLTVRTVSTDSEVIGLAFSPGGQFLAASTRNGVVRVLDPASGETLAWLRHPDSVSGIAFAGDGSLLAVGCADGFGYVYPATWT